jgi:hypothetical protein
MNDRGNREDLLREVLAEATDDGFRAALLKGCLRLAGRRRRSQQARRIAAVVGTVFGLAALTLHYGQPRSSRPKSPDYATVHTQPLAAAAVITTYPMAASQMLTSFPAAGTVQTPPRGRYREIDDLELLDFAAPNPAVLVRSWPDQAELVFASPNAERPPQN